MLFSLLVACLSGSADVQTATAERGDLELHLDFKGELEAKRSASLVSPDLDGRPEIEWIVEDGARVEAGDKLVTFETEEMEKSLAKARSDLDIANARIEQHAARLKLSLGAAEQARVVAELDAELAQMRQTDSETVPLVERETGKVAYTKAQMATQTADTALERVKLDARTELQLLKLEAEKCQRAVERAERQIAMATLTAPSAGLVVIGESWDGKFAAGTRVWPGMVLLTLPDLSEMQVVAWVHEVDSPKVALDQVAKIAMDAHPEDPVRARISRIADLAVERGDARIKHVRVELALDETTPKMKPGMTVGVDLLVQRFEAVVQVPPAAVGSRGTDTIVWQLGVFGWSEVPVQVLARTKDAVAVEGLDPGAVVSLGEPPR